MQGSSARRLTVLCLTVLCLSALCLSGCAGRIGEVSATGRVLASKASGRSGAEQASDSPSSNKKRSLIVAR